MTTPRRRLSTMLGATAVATALIIGAGAGAANAAQASTSLSLKSSATGVALSKTLSVAGSLKSGSRSISGAAVAINYYTAANKSWKRLTTVKTSSAGTYSYTFMPTTGMRLSASFAGTASWRAAGSSTVALNVQPQVYDSKLAGWNGVTVGETKIATGRTVKQMSGKRVVLLWYTADSGWLSAAESRIKTDGTFAIPFTPQGYGTQKYRVYIPPVGGLLGKFSADINVKGYRWNYLSDMDSTTSNWWGDSSTVSVNGVVYGHSVYGDRRDSYGVYLLSRQCISFTAQAGLSDRDNTTGDVGAFEVLLDGNTVYSNRLSYGTTTSITENVTNVLSIKLSDPTGFDGYNTVWGNARVLCSF